MFVKFNINFLISIFFVLFISSISAEEDEIYLKAISAQIQVITKDLKTLEKANTEATLKVNLLLSPGINLKCKIIA